MLSFRGGWIRCIHLSTLMSRPFRWSFPGKLIQWFSIPEGGNLEMKLLHSWIHIRYRRIPLKLISEHGCGGSFTIASRINPQFRTKICNCVGHRGQVNIRKAYSNDPFDSKLKILLQKLLYHLWKCFRFQNNQLYVCRYMYKTHDYWNIEHWVRRKKKKRTNLFIV